MDMETKNTTATVAGPNSERFVLFKRILLRSLDILLDPKVLYIIVFFAFCLFVFFWIGQPLIPVIISLILVYLLDGFVSYLESKKIPRWAGATICFLIALLFFALFVLLFAPLLSRQLIKAMNELPPYLQQLTVFMDTIFKRLQEKLPAVDFSEAQLAVNERIQSVGVWLSDSSARAVAKQVGQWASNVVDFVVVMFLVFFLLKDKKRIQQYLLEHLPGHNELLIRIIKSVDVQVGHFIRGKLMVIGIVMVIATVIYKAIGLKFSLVLAFLTGISSIIPFVGPTVAFFPVAFLGFFQFGLSTDWIIVIMSYGVIQFIEANILTPVIIGHVTKLHPVAIIISLVICGGLWGIWGAFFAIPILILVRGVLANISSYARKEGEQLSLFK